MAAAVITYLTIGVLYSVWDLYFRISTKSITAFGSPLQQSLALAERRRSRTGWARRSKLAARFVLTVPVVVVAWPALIGIGASLTLIRGTSMRHFMGRVSLLPTEIVAPAWFLLLSALLLCARLGWGNGWPVELAAIAITLGVLSSLAYYFLVDQGVASSVRKSLMPPYAQFVVAAGADYVCILIVSTLLAGVGADLHLTRQAVVDRVRELNAFSHLGQAVRSAPHTPTAMLLTVTSLAYFAVFGKLLLQYRSFRREPADHAWLLGALIHAGDFELAQRRLAALPPDVRSKPELLPARIQLSCWAHHFVGAAKLTRLRMELADDPAVAFFDDSVESTMITLSGFARVAPLGDEDYRALVAHAAASRVADAAMHVLTTGVQTSMTEGWTAARLERCGVTRHDYPVTHAFVRWLTEDGEDEALAEADLVSTGTANAPDAAVRLLDLIHIDLYHRRVPSPWVDELSDLLLREGKDFASWFKLEFRGLALQGIAWDLVPETSGARLRAAIDTMSTDLPTEVLQRQEQLREAISTVLGTA